MDILKFSVCVFPSSVCLFCWFILLLPFCFEDVHNMGSHICKSFFKQKDAFILEKCSRIRRAGINIEQTWKKTNTLIEIQERLGNIVFWSFSSEYLSERFSITRLLSWDQLPIVLVLFCCPIYLFRSGKWIKSIFWDRIVIPQTNLGALCSFLPGKGGVFKICPGDRKLWVWHLRRCGRPLNVIL